MRAIAAGMGLGMLLAGASAWTQNNPGSQSVSSTQAVASAASPDYTAVYCSNFITSDRGREDAYLISGEESNSKLVFALRDYVSINRGSSQGVHVGDRYSVFRPVKDPTDVQWLSYVQWFKWQNKLVKAMGTLYQDAGQLKVVNVHPNVSIAEVVFACDYLQRGDFISPMQERPSPPYKPASTFDMFAPVSGKSVGMLVFGKEFTESFGRFSTVYVNLGTNQGVHVGDYLRIFRYQGSHAETPPNFDNFQDYMYGFGSTPAHYKWNDLPRDVLGEAIVLNASANSSTVLITLTRMDVYAGDYVEVE